MKREREREREREVRTADRESRQAVCVRVWGREETEVTYQVLSC